MPLRIAVDVQNIVNDNQTELNGNPTINKKKNERNNMMPIALMVLKGSANTALNHFGDLTGNYVQANQMKLVSNMALGVVALATNPVIASIGLAFSAANSLISDSIQTKKSNVVSSNIANLYKGKGV